MTTPPDPPSGRALYEQGWRQGTLFRSTELSISVNHRDERGQFVAGGRKVKAREALIVATQDCDIVSPDEDYIEAIVCKPENQAFCLRVDRNSAGHFVIDPATYLTAKASSRLLITKGDLAGLTPQPWPSTEERFARFVRWLAGRFDRPAIPDDLVGAVATPIERLLAQLDAEQPGVTVALSRAIQDWRISLPSRDMPPFDVQLILLLSGDTLSAEGATAIDIVADEARRSLDPAQVLLHPDLLVVPDDEFSLREARRSRPLFLEQLTFRGDERIGAPPMPRT